MMEHGQDVMVWSVVCFSAPHSLVAVGSILHLCTVEQNKLMPVQRWLSLTQDDWVDISSMVWVDVTDKNTYAGSITLPCHIPFGFCQTCHSGFQLKKSIKSFSAAGTNVSLFELLVSSIRGGKGLLKSMCSGSCAWQARDSMAFMWQS